MAIKFIFGKTVNFNDKAWLFLFFRYLISLILIFYVVSLVHWGKSWDMLKSANLLLLFVGVLIALLGLLVAALRWSWALAALKINLPVLKAYQIYLLGLFYNQLIPGVIGGDVIRIILCRTETNQVFGLISFTVILERLSGLIAVIILGSVGALLCGLVFDFHYLFNFSDAYLYLVLMVLLILIFLSYLFLLRESLGKYICLKYQKYLCKFEHKIAYAKNLTATNFFHILILSMIFQLSDILVVYVLSQALNINIGFAILLFTMPITYIATVIPIFPGGLGVREGSMVMILGQFNISTSDAALLAVMIFFHKTLLGLIGASQYFINFNTKITSSNNHVCD